MHRQEINSHLNFRVGCELCILNINSLYQLQTVNVFVELFSWMLLSVDVLFIILNCCCTPCCVDGEIT